jgi:hypothetical protein
MSFSQKKNIVQQYKYYRITGTAMPFPTQHVTPTNPARFGERNDVALPAR